MPTRSSHASAAPQLAQITASAPVVTGEQDPDFPRLAGEATWIVHAKRGQVATVAEAGRYRKSQQPDITTGAVPQFPATVHTRA
jgi:hypothetical protein